MMPQAQAGPPEARLLDDLHRIERNPYEWRAAYLHLSRLGSRSQRDYKLRAALSELEPLLQRFEGGTHRLTDGDIVVLCKGATVAAMDEAVLRLRYLFSDGPPMSGAPEGEPEEAGDADTRLFTWYDLETDDHELRQRCEDLLAAVAARRARSGDAAGSAAPPLDARTLVRAERELGAVDVAALLRRQPICALVRNQPPRAVFTEFYVAIGELARALGMGVDLAGNRWLFQHLTGALDERLLAALARDADATETGPTSLNLNVATLLSPAFAQFDRRARDGGRKFLIELQLTDIYAELGAYVFARDLVRRRGYMVCVDGLHHLHLPLIDRARLGADFVKIQWSPDLLDDVGGERRDELRAAIRRTGIERVILCRCGSNEAVQWGQEVGIRLFQGRFLDSRLRAQRSPSVAAARHAIRSVAG